MLGRWLSGNCGPIGLDLGRSTIRMLQFCERGGRTVVQASGHYQLPLDLPEDGLPRQQAIADGCARILESAPFQGRNVASCLPANQMQFKNVRMPHMPDEELTKAVRFEAVDRLQLGDVPHRIDHLVAGEVRQGDEARDEIILMAAPEQLLNDHLELLRSCGLVPVAIDTEPTALTRCFARLFRREEDHLAPRVIVDIGMGATKVLITRGYQVVFFKLIDISGARLNASIAEYLGLSACDASELRYQLTRRESQSDDQSKPLFGSTRRENVETAVFESLRSVIGELGREISLCMRYYSVTFRGCRPEQVFLVGGEANEPQLAQVISGELGMEAQIGKPLVGIDLSGSHIAIERRGPLPDWALAAGLALRPEERLGAKMGRRGAA